MKREENSIVNSQGSLSVSDESIARLLCDDNHVEEAVRLIMINVYKYRSTYSNEYPLSSWLYKIATNESLKLLKNRSGFTMSVDDLGDSLKDSVREEASPDADETLILLQEAIALLPAKQKMVFNLRYYDDKSYEEIHQIVGDSVNTLKTNYHYAVQKIKDYILEHQL